MIILAKRWACLLGAALFFAPSPELSAQHEVGVKLHTINFMGDLGGGGGMGTVFLKDVNVQATTMGLSLEHKRHFAKVFIPHLAACVNVVRCSRAVSHESCRVPFTTMC